MNGSSLKAFMIGLVCGVLFAVPLSILGGFTVFIMLDEVRQGLESEEGLARPSAGRPSVGRPSAGVSERRARDREPYLDRPAPEFSTSTLASGPWRLADHQGKVVVLDFWASWCQPCIQEIPKLRDVYRRYRERPDFVMVGVSVDDKKRDLVSSIDRHEVEWPQLFEDGKGWKNSVARLYQVRSIPHVLVIDRQGIVRAYPRGTQLGAELARQFDAAGATDRGTVDVSQPERRAHVPEGHTLKGVMLYRGVPISEWTDQDPRYTITRSRSRKAWQGSDLVYTAGAGRFEVHDAPPTGTIDISFAVTGGKRILPGDFRATETFDARHSKELELVFEKILHVYEPWDSADTASSALASPTVCLSRS